MIGTLILLIIIVGSVILIEFKRNKTISIINAHNTFNYSADDLKEMMQPHCIEPVEIMRGKFFSYQPQTKKKKAIITIVDNPKYGEWDRCAFAHEIGHHLDCQASNVIRKLYSAKKLFLINNFILYPLLFGDLLVRALPPELWNIVFYISLSGSILKIILIGVFEKRASKIANRLFKTDLNNIYEYCWLQQMLSAIAWAILITMVNHLRYY